MSLCNNAVAELMDACKPVRYMIADGTAPSSPQENANRAWKRLGEEMGFEYMTVTPLLDKGDRFFLALPTPFFVRQYIENDEALTSSGTTVYKEVTVYVRGAIVRVRDEF